MVPSSTTWPALALGWSRRRPRRSSATESAVLFVAVVTSVLGSVPAGQVERLDQRAGPLVLDRHVDGQRPAPGGRVRGVARDRELRQRVPERRIGHQLAGFEPLDGDPIRTASGAIAPALAPVIFRKHFAPPCGPEESAPPLSWDDRPPSSTLSAPVELSVRNVNASAGTPSTPDAPRVDRPTLNSSSRSAPKLGPFPEFGRTRGLQVNGVGDVRDVGFVGSATIGANPEVGTAIRRSIW